MRRPGLDAVIRILVFFVLAVGAASGQPGPVAVGAVLVLLAYPATRAAWAPAWQLVRRLKWILLAFALFYLWGNPGLYIWPDWGGLSPTWQGLEEGGLRLAGLLSVALAASLLMQKTALPELVAALAWLLRPLRPLGLCPDRFAVRVLLVIEWATAAREVASHGGEGADTVDRKAAGGPLVRARRLGEVAVARLQATLDQAESEPPRELVIPVTSWPSSHQWLWPLGLALLLVAVSLPEWP